MSTPAMVVNEKVVSYGKVLKPIEIVKIKEKVVEELQIRNSTTYNGMTRHSDKYTNNNYLLESIYYGKDKN
jgi:hypothetical protein